jgi:hypothetical protein
MKCQHCAEAIELTTDECGRVRHTTEWTGSPFCPDGKGTPHKPMPAGMRHQYPATSDRR